MGQPALARYRFAHCELDSQRHELTVAGIVRHVEPQVFDLLRLFVERGDTLLTHDELIRCVWHDRVVSDSAISVRINAARKAVGDNGAEQSIIRTVPRRGYQLAVVVTRGEDEAAAQVTEDLGGGERTATGNAPESKPVLAVFAFECDAASHRGDYLARGIADDIATELSRFHNLAVLSTFSTFQYDTRNADTHDFAALLGSTHAVTGAMQIVGEKLRLTIRLIHVATRQIIWSERYDIAMQEIFDVQDDVVAKIVASLFSRLQDHELASARRKPTTRLSAYDCVLRGLRIYKGGNVSVEEARQALFWFDRAIEIDPDYARAVAWHACAFSCLWSNPPTTEELTAPMKNIRRAMTLDSGDHEVHRLKGSLHCILGEHDSAEYHLSKSVEINPNDAHILVKIGFYKSFLGDIGNDLALVDLAFQRNPLHPNWYWFDRGVVLCAHERYDEALGNLERCSDGVEANDVYRAACCAALGDQQHAHEILDGCRRINPDLDLDWITRAYPYRCYTGSGRSAKLRELLKAGGLE